MTRRFWLVRHGETEGQSSVRFHGRNDVALSDVGREQIRAIAPLIDGVSFDHVVHSPLSRATESASILVMACSLSTDLLRSDERLREISFGDCEGMTAEEIHERYPEFWQARQAGRADCFPGGEPLSEYSARVQAVARELVAEAWQGDLLVVAHRGTVRQFVRALLDYADDESDLFTVELASLTVLREVPDSARRFQLELLGALP